MNDESKFLDAQGRVCQWPSKMRDKQLVTAYLATKFEFERTYTEPEINAILKAEHTFGDWPLLRRSLVDYGWLVRDSAGAHYELFRHPTSLDGLYLIRPNIVQDTAISMSWLAGEAGEETLRMMGAPESRRRPSTIDIEMQRVRDFVTSTSQRTWALRYEGKNVGAVWVSLASTEQLAGPSIHIMVGDPGARGKGVGLAAIRSVIELLEQEGEYDAMYSRHVTENVASAKMLEKAGFTEDGAPYRDDDGLEWQNVKKALGRKLG